VFRFHIYHFLYEALQQATREQVALFQERANEAWGEPIHTAEWYRESLEKTVKQILGPAAPESLKDLDKKDRTRIALLALDALDALKVRKRISELHTILEEQSGSAEYRKLLCRLSLLNSLRYLTPSQVDLYHIEVEKLGIPVHKKGHQADAFDLKVIQSEPLGPDPPGYQEQQDRLISEIETIQVSDRISDLVAVNKGKSDIDGYLQIAPTGLPCTRSDS
jgi:hypothetical protein